MPRTFPVPLSLLKYAANFSASGVSVSRTCRNAASHMRANRAVPAPHRPTALRGWSVSAERRPLSGCASPPSPQWTPVPLSVAPVPPCHESKMSADHHHLILQVAARGSRRSHCNWNHPSRTSPLRDQSSILHSLLFEAYGPTDYNPSAPTSICTGIFGAFALKDDTLGESGCAGTDAPITNTLPPSFRCAAALVSTAATFSF
jgi:hypothetical protein